jgi:hypothetical protein
LGGVDGTNRRTAENTAIGEIGKRREEVKYTVGRGRLWYEPRRKTLPIGMSVK